MSKSNHFFGQPVFGQLINYLDRDSIQKYSRENGGERYVKSFDTWSHLVVMLYAVIMRFDSLREIAASTWAEVNKLPHLNINSIPRRSTLSDANKRRPESIFAWIYSNLLEKHRKELSSDSRVKNEAAWVGRLRIMDSTTISLFSNLIFKGVGRNPKIGKKKGGIKVHTIIHANEGVPSDIRFTSAATHDSFMMQPSDYKANDILAIDRAYIDYEKFEQMTQNGAIYVTKMKRNLRYEIIEDKMIMNDKGLMVCRIQSVVFKTEKIEHKARIITYVDEKLKKNGKIEYKLVSLLTNDFQMEVEDIIAIYKRRWQIESLFKQIKQNFPLKYFYGESANAIKIQIWITLIANMLLTLFQRRLERSWSFSGLATMVRIVLMYYINMDTFFERPEEDWETIRQKSILQAQIATSVPPPNQKGGLADG